MDKHFMENVYVLIYAATDVWDTFKNIVAAFSAVFFFLLAWTRVNPLLAIILFIVTPLASGLIWGVLYRRAFDEGVLTLKDVESDDEEDE